MFASPGTKRWDTLAPEAILRALGGFLVDSEGVSYAYNVPPFQEASDIPREAVYNTRGLVAGLSSGAYEHAARALQWGGNETGAA